MNVSKYLFIILSIVTISWFLTSKEESEKQEVTTFLSTLYNFDTSNQGRYSLNFNQNSILLASDMIAKDIVYTYDIEAILNVRVIEKKEKFLFLAMQLSSFKLDGIGVTKDMLDKLVPYYTSMFLVKMSYYGRVLDIYFPGKMINYNGLYQLVSLLQVVNTKESNYEVDEKDLLGLYKAFYRKKLYDIQKQKILYKRVDNPDREYSIDVKKFDLSATIDSKESWLLDLDIDENILIRDNKKVPYAKNINLIELEKIYTQIDSSLKIWKENKSVDQILKEFQVSIKKDKDIFKVIEKEKMKQEFIKNKTTLDALVQDLKLDSANSSIYRKIGKYITAFPKSTDKLKIIILESDENISMNLISVLSRISTPEAQIVLSDVAKNNSTNDMNNIRAIIGLGGVEKATQTTLDVLVEISSTRGNIELDDKSDTALLALASHTNDDKDINQGIVSYIKSEYSAGLSLSKEKNILYSMQNAGAKNFVEELKQSLNSSSSKVRLISINIVSTIEDKLIRDDILYKQLLIEKDKNIKESINRILSKK